MKKNNKTNRTNEIKDYDLCCFYKFCSVNLLCSTINERLGEKKSCNCVKYNVFDAGGEKNEYDYGVVGVE